MPFLQYTGVVKYEMNNYEYYYRFKIKGRKDLLLDHYDEVPSPAIDNIFQKIFGQNNDITKSLLNSLLYLTKYEIETVEFILTNFLGPIDLEKSLYSLRTDVVCQCTLKNKKVIIIDFKYR